MDLHMEDALLTGLVVCGNCGRRLKTDHPAHGKSYYRCARHLYEATEQACFGLKATVVDDLVRDQVLHALEPAALELSCRALEDVQRDRVPTSPHCRTPPERPTRIARSSSGTSWIKSSFMWSTIVNMWASRFTG